MPGDPDGFARAHRLAAHLPGVEVTSQYGRRALKVQGKYFAGSSRVDGALGVYCPVELKEHLIEARPDIYFETDHYRGWPAVLVRMDAVDDATLQSRLEAAWASRAPKKLLKQMESEE
ncbi:MAG: MmcQ/YjbR family DNA-binding protein [Sphingomonadales bacterium]